MSDVQRGNVYESRDPRHAGRRVRVVGVIDEPATGGNGCIANGPVAVVEPVTGGRQTRIAVWRLASSRWTLVALAALMFGCDDPPPRMARQCEAMGSEPMCVHTQGFRCLEWSCRVSHLEADAGVDAATDGGPWDFGASVEGVPMRPAGGLR